MVHISTTVYKVYVLRIPIYSANDFPSRLLNFGPDYHTGFIRLLRDEPKSLRSADHFSAAIVAVHIESDELELLHFTVFIFKSGLFLFI